MSETLTRQAAKLFRSFFDRAPKQGDLVRVESATEIGFIVGELVGVIYKVDGEKLPMIHKFNSNDRPCLFVSSDGRQACILQGGYRFTGRGFVG
jgi:hypothetical protein